MRTLERELDYSKLVGIKRPDLIFNFNALHNVRMVAGDSIKIIVLLRDPVARAISQFFHFRGLALIKFCSFRDFVDAILGGTLPSLGLRAHEIDAHSRYRDAIDNARRHFPAEMVARSIVAPLPCSADQQAKTVASVRMGAR
jgi:hypothetical protein